MSPITITCTACDAKLRVRNPSALGKVFSCPSCGAMVVVDRPTNGDGQDRTSRWRERKRAANTSQSLLDSSYDAVNDLLDSPPVTAPSPIQEVMAQRDAQAVSAPKATATEAPQTRNSIRSRPTPEVSSSQENSQKIVARRKPTRAGRRSYWQLVAATLVGAALAVLLLREFLGTADATAANSTNASVVAMKPALARQFAASAHRDISAELQAVVAEMPESVSLANLVRHVSWSIDVPISIDTESLKYCRVAMGTRVGIRSANKPVVEMLNDSLSPLKLTANVYDGWLMVESEAEPQDRLTKEHDVSDLIAGEMTGPALLQMISDFVRPESWQSAGGIGTLRLTDDLLTVNHTNRMHVDVLHFCNALRQSRGVPIRGNQALLTESGAAMDSQIQLLQSRLDMECDEAIRLDRLLPKLEKAAGCHFIVNWQTLIEEGRGSNDRVILQCNDVTLEEALTRITDQLQLTFRVVRPSVIEITTRAAERGTNIVVFHSIEADPAREESIVKFVDSLALPEVTGRRVALEPISRSVVTRLPWSAQLRLAKALR